MAHQIFIPKNGPSPSYNMVWWIRHSLFQFIELHWKYFKRCLDGGEYNICLHDCLFVWIFTTSSFSYKTIYMSVITGYNFMVWQHVPILLYFIFIKTMYFTSECGMYFSCPLEIYKLGCSHIVAHSSQELPLRQGLSGWRVKKTTTI